MRARVQGFARLSSHALWTTLQQPPADRAALYASAATERAPHARIPSSRQMGPCAQGKFNPVTVKSIHHMRTAVPLRDRRRRRRRSAIITPHAIATFYYTIPTHVCVWCAAQCRTSLRRGRQSRRFHLCERGANRRLP